jgi:homoserine acetyltransferase
MHFSTAKQFVYSLYPGRLSQCRATSSDTGKINKDIVKRSTWADAHRETTLPFPSHLSCRLVDGACFLLPPEQLAIAPLSRPIVCANLTRIAMPPTQYFEHTLQLASLSEPFSAKVAYCTYGDSQNPAILLPTCYGGKLATTLTFLYTPGEGGSDAEPIISPAKYFVIVAGLMGGGESSSPSNTPSPFNAKNFPFTSYEDNIHLQVALAKSLGVEKLFAYIGFSMGGQQAYHISTLYPDFVERFVCIAGSARTSWHNYSFLEGPKAALINSVDFKDGDYTADDPCTRGTKAFGRVYSTWALSQEWFRQKSWETLGYGSLEEYLKGRWEGGLGIWDAHDLLCLLRTWQDGDITKYHPEDGGDLSKTLGRIKAKGLIMPSRTDLYFPPEDSMEEVKHLRDGKLVIIESIWGHLAGGGGGTKEDCEFIKTEVGKFLHG